MNNMKSILWGVVLVLLGVLVGTNSLGITNIDIFFDGWWSLFIIIPCFIGLFSNEDKTGNIIGLLVGVILLLGMNDILDLDKIWKLIVPSIIEIWYNNIGDINERYKSSIYGDTIVCSTYT